jgi:hypothetical protein
MPSSAAGVIERGAVLRLSGRSSKGKRLVRELGAAWVVVAREGDNVLLVSPPTRPTEIRAIRERGDPNLTIETG